jgi:hypothetical protein
MVPAINHGDQVKIQSCQAEELCKGDVIAFWRNSSLFVHRLYGQKNGMLLTKGDRCRNFDPPVERERVFGRVDSVMNITGTGLSMGAQLRKMEDKILSTFYSLIARITVKLY